MTQTAEKAEEPDREPANERGVGDNSKAQGETALEYFKNRVRIDAAREELNEQADANRQMAREAELVTSALDVEYKYWKSKSSEQEGYDETVSITKEALNNADTRELFAELDTAKLQRSKKKKALSKGNK